MVDIRALLFDSNGTIVDMEADEGLEEIYQAMSNFLMYQGIATTWEELRGLYFRTLEQQLAKRRQQEQYPETDAVQLWTAILESKARDSTRSMSLRKWKQLPLCLAEMHRSISCKRLGLYPHVREVLVELHARYRLAIVTDAQHIYAIPELRAIDVDRFFKLVIVSSVYGYRKPDPRLFQKALDGLKLQPEQALFIGNDMHRDIYGAKRMGMKSILFSSKQGGKQLPGVEPDCVIENFAELPHAIKSLVK